MIGESAKFSIPTDAVTQSEAHEGMIGANGAATLSENLSFSTGGFLQRHFYLSLTLSSADTRGLTHCFCYIESLPFLEDYETVIGWYGG